MIKKLLAAVLVWVCVFENTVFAQKENYVWYFGDHAGVDFNSGIPVALTNGAMYQWEGCASICDANGTLLFYTDGVIIWDHNHSQMPNGDSLAGSTSTTQSALIVPFPGNNLMYYVFTVQSFEQPTNHNFSFSIIDMSLNSGNGDVTAKNNIIKSPVTEKLAAVRHSNGNDTWVMVHGYGNDSLFAYLVTGSGISTTPVVSKTGQLILFNTNDALGYMKFSPDGSKLAFAATETNYVDLFDFNSTTGIVSNEKLLNLPPLTGVNGAYGLEFSGSGNYLYTALNDPGFIYQWDVSSNIAAVINSSIQQIDSGPSGQHYGALQMGPGGKIYFSYWGRSYLGAINNPELPGILCNFADSVVSLNGNSCIFGLPNFISSYFLPTGISNPQSSPDQTGINLQLYPNPATDKIYISLPSSTSETITIKIYSITGENLFQSFRTLEKVNSAIDVTGLSNGIYFLSVRTGKEKVTGKIVVNH